MGVTGEATSAAVTWGSLRGFWRLLAGGAVLGVVGAALSAGPASAQDRDDVAADPRTWAVQPADEDGADGRAHFEYEGPAGGTISDYVQVSNYGEQPLTVRVYSQDAVNTGDGGFTLRPGDEPPVGVGAWVGLDEEVTLEPGESEVVAFTLRVPDNATPGDHPGGIVASAVAEGTDAQGSPVLVDYRVGTRIYLRVDGELAPALQVTWLDAGYERTWLPLSGGTTTVTYQVTNIGNVRLSGQQELTVRGPFGLAGRSVTLAELPEILPGESVTASGQIDSLAPLLLLSTELRLLPAAPGGDELAVEPVTTGLRLWAVPWPELAVLALVALAVWWSLWRHRRRTRRTEVLVAQAAAKAREQAHEQARREQHQETAPTPDQDADRSTDHESAGASGSGPGG